MNPEELIADHWEKVGSTSKLALFGFGKSDYESKMRQKAFHGEGLSKKERVEHLRGAYKDRASSAKEGRPGATIGGGMGGVLTGGMMGSQLGSMASTGDMSPKHRAAAVLGGAAIGAGTGAGSAHYLSKAKESKAKRRAGDERFLKDEVETERGRAIPRLKRWAKKKIYGPPKKEASAHKEALFGFSKRIEHKPIKPSEKHHALAKKYDMNPHYIANDVDHPDYPDALEHNVAWSSALQRHHGGPGKAWDHKKWGRPHAETGEGMSDPHKKVASVYDAAYEEILRGNVKEAYAVNGNLPAHYEQAFLEMEKEALLGQAVQAGKNIVQAGKYFGGKALASPMGQQAGQAVKNWGQAASHGIQTAGKRISQGGSNLIQRGLNQQWAGQAAGGMGGAARQGVGKVMEHAGMAAKSAPLTTAGVAGAGALGVGAVGAGGYLAGRRRGRQQAQQRRM